MSCCYSASSGCKLQFSFLQIEEMQQGTLTAQQKVNNFHKGIFGRLSFAFCCTKMDVLFNVSDCEIDKSLQTVIILSI